MKRQIIILAAVLGLTAVPAGAQAPAETPFPSPKIVGTFVRVQTVTSAQTGLLTNFFPRGSTVVFRMFVGNNKTKTSMTNKDLAYAKILVPGQPNVKLTYTGADRQWPWVGNWNIPADFTLGSVAFQATIKTKAKVYGSFVQIPVVTSQLTVTAS
ncbi:MAG: hypothetical protein ABWY51_08970 [Gaiellaceae bacterium]